MSAGGLRGATVALQHREFRIFWIAAFVSNTGGWMQSAGLPYVAYQLTGTNGGVGATGFMQYVPVLIAGAVGGWLADSFDLRKLLILTQLAQACFAFALWVLVSQGWATPTSLAAVAFLGGLASGLNIPVWQSFVGKLVPRSIMLNAVTLNSTQFNAARACGTFSAGIVIALAGPSLVFAIDAVSFVAVLFALSLIRDYRRRDPVPRVHPVRDLIAGARYVWGTGAIRSACFAIAAVAGFASPLFSFLPASYGQDEFGVTGWRLGLLLGAGGIGSLGLAPLILTRGATMSRRRLLGVSMATYALATMAVGLAPTWQVAVVGLACYGGSYLAIASALNTTIQLTARDDMRGKALAIFVMCLTGALPLGLLVWGWAADTIGIRPVTVGAGAMLLGATVIMWFRGTFEAMVVPVADS